MKSSRVNIQGICYDEKSSFSRGPAKAPPIIRDRLLSDAYNAYAENGIRISESWITDYGDFAIEDYQDIKKISERHLEPEVKLFTIGGDHSITYPVVQAIKSVYSEFEILHIDAHADLYNDFEGDKYSHACPFARIMEDRLVDRLVQVGIRTLTPHQREQAEKYNVEIVEMKDFDLNTLPSFSKPIYLSLDIDAFDPSCAPGVSHQESGGFSARDVVNILHRLKAPIIGADLVEYNPNFDVQGITSALCAKMMKEILSLMV